MLVLARKIDEAITIGDDIVVKVISVDKGVVKLGIDAPHTIAIVRNELLEDVKEANIAAAKETNREDLTQLSKLLKK